MVAAFDFRNTNPASFDVNVIYNDTYANRTTDQPSFVIRVSRSLNMVSLALKLAYEEGSISIGEGYLDAGLTQSAQC